MKTAFLSAAAGLLLVTAAQASSLATSTSLVAEQTQTYGTFHDQPTHHVFVKLPSGWKFVGKDDQAQGHEVFRDASTGFVFVKLSQGWKFVGANFAD